MSKRENADEMFFKERGAGGFTRLDGTIQFYTRVKALIEPQMTVLDLGAGRGALAEADAKIARTLSDLRGGGGKKVIGLDVDSAVLKNPRLDEALVYDGRTMPLVDHSVDLIVADNTLEHIDSPVAFAAEVGRVLKPGGWLCARTPHLYSLLALAATFVPNRLHASVLGRVQPTREARDTFPTVYRLNTRKALRGSFRRVPGKITATHGLRSQPTTSTVRSFVAFFCSTNT
ncbi:MAG TPA: methyltransferase domain-containing protein [Xanthobacteraceae bacterium]|jgi:SAM-dependent methyltransferase|nr:methyltransferase domain-containing protein [Xanthobacteraceae bacterium]